MIKRVKKDCIVFYGAVNAEKHSAFDHVISYNLLNDKTYLLKNADLTAQAAVGIAVPVLPTTPFLLLAAFFYARSSQRFHDALLGNRLFGSYIRNYVERRGMTRRSKVATLALLWLGIGLAATFATDILAMRLTLLLIAAGVTLHILTLRTAETTPH